jgi:D-xylulose reductase
MAVAKAYGAKKVIAFNISTTRVEFAESYAADQGFVCPFMPKDTVDVMAWNDSLAAGMLKEMGEAAMDVVLEASGAESAMQLGISLLRPGGTCESMFLTVLIRLVVAAGMGLPMTSFPSLELSAKELDVRGSL